MKTTSIPILFTLLFLTVCRGFSAVPDKIDGFVYYESASTIARSSSSFAIVLAADGVFSGLYSRSSGVIAGSPTILSSQVGGTYTYQKLNDQTAELTLSIPLGGFSPGKRTLRFTSDLDGDIPPATLPTSLLNASFRFAPLSSRAPLSNCSNRSYVRAGGSAFTGFVITAGGSGRALVRAVGPSLAGFGVTGALGNPRLSIVNASTNAVVATNDDWSSESAQAISRTAAIVGAFPLVENSQDSAVIVSLAPGAYIAQVSSASPSDSGESLIEVYLLP